MLLTSIAARSGSSVRRGFIIAVATTVGGIIRRRGRSAMIITDTTMRSRGGLNNNDVLPTAWTSSYATFVASAAPTTLSASLPRRRPLFASETPPPPKDAMTSTTSTCEDDEIISTHSIQPTWSSHPDDPSLWSYHIESTSSTMDEARKMIVEGKFNNNDDDDAADRPKSFLVSATSQSAGRGTSRRNWQSSKRGNALFTIGIRRSSWMDGLEVKNNGRAVPLTLLPLKIGSLVATRIREALEAECLPKSIDDNNRCDGILMPMVTVKWPNDVLLRNSTSVRHEKIAGVLIETYEDWFLIGIGINVGYAPSVPSEGDDRGRDATCLARYCHTDADDYIVGAVEEMVGVGYGPMKIIVPEIDEKEEENRWIETSKQLAMDVAYDLHSWLHYDDNNNNNAQQSQRQIGESILDDWKSFVDWDMELTLRDTPNRERVTLEGVLEDGRVIVKEVDTGQTRTLVADYFL